MALFEDGLLCHYCGKPMTSSQDLIGFTFVGSRDPLLRQIDDAVVHAECLSRHPQRDSIVAVWNREAHRRLGPVWMLAISNDGRVRHFNWVDKALYYLGLRRYQ